MKKIAIIIGTRPETIKMSPVIKEFKKNKKIKTLVISSGQHKEIMKPILNFFNVKIDIDLDLMIPNQRLIDLQNNILTKMFDVFEKEKPDFVLVQGDTTTVLSSAMAAFYLKIPIGHLEAGLRTGDINNPFPEEMNRKMLSQISTINFCPTKLSLNNLKKENINKNTFIVGNTVIDALLKVSKKIKIKKDNKIKKILLTAHRRENQGEPLKNIFESILEISKERNDIEFIYPVHPNPNVKILAEKMLSNVNNIKLIPPLDYFDFIKEMKESYIILTDSGGVQEEAPSLKKPILILRKNTERPEIITCGAAKLVGDDKNKIKKEIYRLLDEEKYYTKMSKIKSPFGDGKSSKKITKIVLNFLKNKK